MTSSMAQFCEHCGTSLESNAKFCRGCGQSVSVAVQTVAPAPANVAASVAALDASSIAPAPSSDYSRLKKLYNQAAQVDPSQRDAFLVSMCGDDQGMLNELRNMFVTQSAVASGMPPQPLISTAPISGNGAQQTDMIGAYRLLRELGRGGMGVVYLAVRDDGAFRKNVALKLLLRECVNAEFISRFKQERQVLAALDHPNIARILDGGDTMDGMPYYVMEYVEGLPLDKYCDQQRLSLTGRIKIFQQVCLAVDYLHQNSILHRDLKPSNILVSSDHVVKLLDFGIAKVVGAGAFANPDLTTAQGRPMTPTYASPEQLAGTTLHKTSDLYSLGAILYSLLTGRSAYNDLDDKLAKIAARELPTKPSTNIREDLRSAETTAQFRRAMMGELDSIVLMAMQIDPKDRYQSSADLTQDLQRFIDGSPVTAYHGSAAGRGVKLLRRKRSAVAVLCAFVVLVIFGVWQWIRLDHQRAEAASSNARLSALVDRLEARVNNGQPVEDVRQLKDGFQKELTDANGHDELLARGVKYLDRVRALAPADPSLNVQVGDAYQQLGTLQEKDGKSPNAGKTALATFQKAATTLASTAVAQGTEAGQAKQQLASLNARITQLGGTALALPQVVTDQVPQAITPPPPIPVNLPAQTTIATKPAHPRPLPTAAPTQQQEAPPPPVPGPKPTEVSADTEDRLSTVAAKVQIADQAIEPVRQSLGRDGQTLNADTLTRIARMHSSLDRARRAVANGNEADAKESLAAAEALADKVLHSLGR